ncbi:MAG: hypothetical protein ACI4P0_02030, partial [Mailhella sp.]
MPSWAKVRRYWVPDSGDIRKQKEAVSSFTEENKRGKKYFFIKLIEIKSNILMIPKKLKKSFLFA